MTTPRLAFSQAPAELKILVLGFLLNLPWELLQMPLYAGVPDLPHWQAIKVCMQATVGDAVILVIAFWTASVVVRRRSWLEEAPLTGRPILIFILTGIVITFAIETLAVQGRWIQQWQYATVMPVVPGTAVGLSPALQWLVVPAALLWMYPRRC